jgi:hypothetical protein
MYGEEEREFLEKKEELENQEMEKVEQRRKRWTSEKYTPGYCDCMADSLLEWVETHFKEEKCFFLGDWAFTNSVNPRHLGYMDTRSEKFKIAHQVAKSYQEHTICKGSLLRKYDGNFAKFMLANHHGYNSNPDKDRETELENDFSHFMKHIKKVKKDNGSSGTLSETDNSAK